MPAAGANRGYAQTRLPGAKSSPAPKITLPQKAPGPSLPPILPAPRGGTSAATRASQAQKAAAYSYHAPPHGHESMAPYTAATAAHQQEQRQQLDALRSLLNHSYTEHQIDTNPGGLAGVAAALGDVPVVGHLDKAILGDLIHLPGDTLKSGIALGGAFGHDALSGLGLHSGKSEALPLLKSAWDQSFTKHLVHGDLPGAWKAFQQHPLYSASEVMGDYGALGRVAGAVGRSGLLGSRAAELAGTARDARPVLRMTDQNGQPVDLLPPALQSYSKNLITKGAQKLVEHDPALEASIRKVTGRSGAAEMRKRVDEFHATSQARSQEVLSGLTQQLKEAMPTHDIGPQVKGRGVKRKAAAADVTPFVHMGVAGPKAQFVQHLEGLLGELKTHEPNLSGQELAYNLEHQHNIQAFLDNPNIDQLTHAAETTTALQHKIDTARDQLGLTAKSEGERAALKPFIQTGHMPGVSVTDERVPTQANLDAKSAARDLAGIKKELNDAGRTRDKALVKARMDAKTEIANARQRLMMARKQSAKAEGVLTGRHGLNPALPQSAAERLWRYQARVTQAEQDFQAAKIHAVEHIRDTKQFHLDTVDAHKANLKDARQEYALIHKPVQNEKVTGIVQQLPTGAFRQVPTSEIHSFLDTEGIPRPAYLNKTLPNEGGVAAIQRKFRLSRGGSRGRASTAAGVKAGVFVPGYRGIARTLIGKAADVQRAMTNDEFMKLAAAKAPTGEPRYFNLDRPGGKAELDHAKAEIEAATGQKMVAIPAHPKSIDEYKNLRAKSNQGLGAHWADEATAGPRDNIVLVPKPMLDRYLKHLKVDDTRSGALSTINRQFRNTVLPWSPKWFTGNVIEAGLRSALVGAGPLDHRLAGTVINRMKELGLNEQAAHLERMATGGLHYGMNERMNRDAIGLNEGSGNATAHELRQLPVIKQIGDGYAGTVQGIFHFNRWVESNIEKSVLGAHMRHTMQEFAGSWLKATKSQKDYIDALAHGYADAHKAAEAGRYIHETLGQYDRFSPAMRRVVRSVAPFLPWYRNAVKFVYHTLPFKHPVAQAVLLAASRNLPDNQGVPHDKFFGEPVGDLLTAKQVGPGAYLNLGRYTPEGAFTQGPLDFALNAALPQAAGAAHAMLGQDPFGRGLVDDQGKAITDTGAQLGIALSNLGGGFTGAANQLKRILVDEGNTPYNSERLWDLNPKLKPGTHHGPSGVLGGLDRVMNPFFPTYLKRQDLSSSTGGVISGKAIVPGGGAHVISGKAQVVK